MTFKSQNIAGPHNELGGAFASWRWCFNKNKLLIWIYLDLCETFYVQKLHSSEAPNKN